MVPRYVVLFAPLAHTVPPCDKLPPGPVYRTSSLHYYTATFLEGALGSDGSVIKIYSAQVFLFLFVFQISFLECTRLYFVRDFSESILYEH